MTGKITELLLKNRCTSRILRACGYSMHTLRFGEGLERDKFISTPPKHSKLLFLYPGCRFPPFFHFLYFQNVSLLGKCPKHQPSNLLKKRRVKSFYQNPSFFLFYVCFDLFHFPQNKPTLLFQTVLLMKTAWNIFLNETWTPALFQ